MFCKNMNEVLSYVNQLLHGHFQNYTAMMQDVNIIQNSSIGNCRFQNDFYGICYLKSLVILKWGSFVNVWQG